MNIITFRGESNVKEVTNRLFTRLTPRQQERAEAAILKANPQLRNIRRVPKGTVLEVPDLPELQAKRKPDQESPKSRFNEQLVESLDMFSKQFAEEASAAKEDGKVQISLLKSRQFKGAIANNPQLRKQATEVSRALTTRVTEVGERNKTVQLAVKQILKDL
jgi:hypothetical protein